MAGLLDDKLLERLLQRASGCRHLCPHARVQVPPPQQVWLDGATGEELDVNVALIEPDIDRFFCLISTKLPAPGELCIALVRDRQDGRQYATVYDR